MQRQRMGPQGGFSYFVFKQLYGQKRYSTLLRLGEEFQEELLIFLQQHKELLWLHEIFLNQFSSASENLHALGLSQDNTSSVMAEESFDPNYVKPELSLSDRRRFLNLSKIAAAVGMRFFPVPSIFLGYHKFIFLDIHIMFFRIGFELYYPRPACFRS